MFAAAAAAEDGNEVHLFEKNERLGKKIYITGKGRCNLTNACDPEEFFGNVCSNRKFLYSAFYGCTNQDVIAFFERHGCKTKVERGQRVFPVSDKSADVIDALRRAMMDAGVQIHLNCEVRELLTEPSGDKKRACGIRLADGKTVSGDAVLVATGGFAYNSGNN